MKESKFQSHLIKTIKERIPGSMVLKNDAGYIQGIPDLLILHNDRWAALEVKNDPKASKQPNQDFYISKMNEMSFAAFVDPSNEEDVLNELERSLSA